MKGNTIRRKLATVGLALTLATGGVAAGSVATAPPAAADTYGPVVNVKMGPYKHRATCWAWYALSVSQGHVTLPCKAVSGGWSYTISRFLFVG